MKAWTRAVRRQNLLPNQYSSDHFSEDQKNLTYPSGPRLREGAVPNIFASFPDYLKPSQKPKRKAPTEINVQLPPLCNSALLECEPVPKKKKSDETAQLLMEGSFIDSETGPINENFFKVMGNENSKKKHGPNITPDQKESILNSLENVDPGLKNITSETLMSVWRDTLSEGLKDLFIKYLFRNSKVISIEQYEYFFYSMVEASLEEKAKTLMALLGIDNNIPPINFQMYVSELLQSYLMILNIKFPEAYNSWQTGDLTQKADIMAISYFLIKDINYCDDGMVPIEELENWLRRCAFLREVSDSVINIAFGMLNQELKPVLPYADRLSTLLRIPTVLLLTHLTRAPMSKWRLLYSSSTEPHSWQIFQSRLCKQGPTLVLIQDHAGPLIGGYASNSWKITPTFYGDENSFLFRLRPDVLICVPTEYNRNFQYLNSGAATLPNGLGMGGQLNYFGFFLSSEFGPGSVSKTCTTFRDYIPLASQLEFTFSQLEVWAIGEPDLVEEGVREVGPTGLIMQRDPGAVAMLELAGRTLHAKEAGELPEDDGCN